MVRPYAHPEVDTVSTRSNQKNSCIVSKQSFSFHALCTFVVKAFSARQSSLSCLSDFTALSMSALNALPRSMDSS